MEKRGILVLLVFFVLVFSISSSLGEKNFSKKEIIEQKKIENSGKQRYYVYYESYGEISSKTKLNLEKNKQTRPNERVYSVKLNSQELTELKKDKAIKVYPQKIYKTVLQDSTSIVNSTSANRLQFQSINLTGTRSTVCIIDTGANYSHQSLGNGFGPGYKILGGYDTEYDTEDFTDLEGHGTHVAGIVAASGNLNGIAKGANLLIIAAYNYDVEGFYDDSLREAIDQCIQNKTRYNISVISMSLGGGQNNSFCDTDVGNTLLSQKIQEAINLNISVVVATGNTGNGYNDAIAGIASPACFQNVTRVGATNKDDTYAGYGFRNSNFLDTLFAPGTNVNSTNFSGIDYVTYSGTSMSAPQVSGAIAILNQYLYLENRQLTPGQINEVLNATGKRIYDSSTDETFSRIDVYSALLSLDQDSPTTNLISPANNSANAATNFNFSFNVTDWQIKNSTFYLWYSNGTLLNQQTVNLTGTQNSSLFSLQINLSGNYVWNVISSDSLGNRAFATNNYSFSVDELVSSLNSPTNNTYTNINLSTFNCSAMTDPRYALTNITLYVWNSSGIVNYSSREISGLQNSSLFDYNLSAQTNYSWNCLAYNNRSNSSFAEENFSLTFDITPPEISEISSSVTTASATISWNTNESANSSIDIIGQNKKLSTAQTSHSLTFTELSSSTSYEFNVTSCDLAGNCNRDNGTFTTSSNPPGNSGGSPGGGGGGGGVTTIILSEEETLRGVSKTISNGASLKLKISSQNHTLTLNKATNTSANLTIRSNPLNFILKIGEGKKLNLSSESYYDLYIELENSSNGKANLMIKQINESILNKKDFEEPVRNSSNETKIYVPFEKNSTKNSDYVKRIVLAASIVIIIIVFILVFLEKSLVRARKPIKKTKK